MENKVPLKTVVAGFMVLGAALLALRAYIVDNSRPMTAAEFVSYCEQSGVTERSKLEFKQRGFPEKTKAFLVETAFAIVSPKIAQDIELLTACLNDVNIEDIASTVRVPL